MNKISIEKLQQWDIDPNKMVTVHLSPQYMQITCDDKDSEFPYKKLSKNTMLNTKTGEIIAVKDNNSDFRSFDSLKNTFSNLLLLINCNYYGDEKTEHLITLTYKGESPDNDRFNKDLRNFRGRFDRRNKENIPFRWIVIKEYQQNGNTHIHILLKRLDGKDLTRKYLKKLLDWNKGSVNIKSIYKAYGLSEYFNSLKVSKKRACLKFYEKYERILRNYGDIIKPTSKKMSYKEALQIAENNQFKEFKKDINEVLNNSEVVNKTAKILFKKEGDDKNNE